MRRAICGASLLVVVAMLGCGPPPTTLSGRITLDDAPLAGGFVIFIPTAGDGPTSQATTDAAGRFHARVPATQLSVAVSRYEFRGQTFEGEPRADETIPARYSDHDATTLRATPVAGTDTKADFALESKPR